MIVVTTERAHGYEVHRVLGMVRGSSIRARHFGRTIVGALRTLAGGEVYEFTKLMAETREQAMDRMVAEARALGANAILAVRFQSAEVSRNAAEMLCYGTAVIVGSDADALEGAEEKERLLP